MPKINLLGNAFTARSLAATAQYRQNFYLEFIPDGGDKSRAVAYPTPGLLPWWGAGEGEGFDAIWAIMPVDVNGIDALAIIANSDGDTVLQVFYGLPLNTDSVVLLDGTVTTEPIIMATNMATTGTQLLIALHTTDLTLYDLSTDALTQTTLAFMDAPIDWVASMDQRFIMHANQASYPGRFYFSNLLDGTSWGTVDPGDQYLTCESFPDKLTRGLAYRGFLVMFGERSTEFWQGTGDLNAPFAPVIGATGNYGLSANDRYTPQIVGSSLLFVATMAHGTRSVCMLNGYEAIPISPPDLDYKLATSHHNETASAVTFRLNGHDFYLLNLETASYLYDLTSSVWSLWVSPGRTGSQIVCACNASGATNVFQTDMVSAWSGGFTWDVYPESSPTPPYPVRGYTTVFLDNTQQYAFSSSPELGTITLPSTAFTVTCDATQLENSTVNPYWTNTMDFYVQGTTPINDVISFALCGQNQGFTADTGTRVITLTHPLAPAITVLAKPWWYTDEMAPILIDAAHYSGSFYQINNDYTPIKDLAGVYVGGYPLYSGGYALTDPTNGIFSITSLWNRDIPASATVQFIVSHTDVACTYANDGELHWTPGVTVNTMSAVRVNGVNTSYSLNEAKTVITITVFVNVLTATALESIDTATPRPIVSTDLGWLCLLDSATYTEPNLSGESIPLVREVVLPHLFDGGEFNKVLVNRFRLEAESDAEAFAENDPVPITMYISRDGGNNYGTALDRYFSGGDKPYRAEWRRLGMARDWVFKVQVANALKTTLLNAFVTYEVADK